MTVFEAKGASQIDAPVLLFRCEAGDGRKFYWSTERLVVEGREYEPRVLRHNAHEVRLGGEESVDAVNRLTVTLSNVDGLMASVERAVGWKGAKLDVRFGFFDVGTGTATTELVTVFQGRGNALELLTENSARLSFGNRLSLSRVMLPELRIQKRCPWRFPATAAERMEAKDVAAGEAAGLLQRCGYSADLAGGVGNLNGGAAYTSCEYTARACEERGMFRADSAGRGTARFGGLQYLPPVVQVRSHNERGSHLSAVIENQAKYNDYVPLVYGTAWMRPAIIFGRNDGNLTRLEVLLGSGPMAGPRKVIVNGVEIPRGRVGANMTGTGWWNPVSDGSRGGAFNLDFGNGVGDPHGSLATISVVVPNRVADGNSTPRIEVLCDGMKLAQYDGSGALVAEGHTANPAWVLLDLMRRCGWRTSEMDLGSFASAAAYCAELVESTGVDGGVEMVARAECHVAIQKRRSAAELVRGIRMGAGLMLGYGFDGRLEVRVEGSLATQHGTKAAGSNAATSLGGGWPVFEFGDGSQGRSDIAMRGGKSTFRMWAKGAGEVPNRYALDFVNARSEWQADGVSLEDFGDVEQTGQEISANLPAVGVSSLGQALRVLRLQLRKSVDGNLLVTFETGARGIGLRPGDLITVTYARHGLDREVFRVISIAPGENYGGMEITAQLHRDGWYTDAGLDWTGARLGQSEVRQGLPRPVAGAVGVSGGASGVSDVYAVAAEFTVPGKPSGGLAGNPVLALTAAVSPAAGGLNAGGTWYYGVSAVDGSGDEGPLSSLVRVELPVAAGTYAVTLERIAMPEGATGMRVYRGLTPSGLTRIAETGVAASFTDGGLAEGTAAAPDGDFDHVNVYWRWVKLPATAATAWGSDSIGGSGLGLVVDAHRGDVVRIVSGKGAGQERLVSGNGSDVLTVKPDWAEVPDAGSAFVIAEGGWRFGCASASSPARFEVPWRGAAWVEVGVRAANASDREVGAELSPVAEFRLPAGAAGGDVDVPGAPVFALSSGGEGSLEVSGVGFGSLENTATADSGLLKVYYVDEKAAPSGLWLTSGMGASGGSLACNGALGAGTLIQVDGEVMRVVSGGAGVYVVERGVMGSGGAAHDENAAVYRLAEGVFTLSFTRGMFGTEAGGNWSQTVELGGVRVASAALSVTNRVGAGPWFEQSFTGTSERGIRTLGGGQLVMQVPGYLAAAEEAVPRVELDRERVVRDVYARVAEAPLGTAIQMQLRAGSVSYGDLVIPAGQLVSNVISGWDREVLGAGTLMGLRIVSVGQVGAGNPGRDLSVTVRF